MRRRGSNRRRPRRGTPRQLLRSWPATYSSCGPTRRSSCRRSRRRGPSRSRQIRTPRARSTSGSLLWCSTSSTPIDRWCRCAARCRTLRACSGRGCSSRTHAARRVPRAVRFEHAGHTCWLRMFSRNARDKIDVERKNARALAAARRRRARTPAATAHYSPPRALTAVEFARGIPAARWRSFP